MKITPELTIEIVSAFADVPQPLHEELLQRLRGNIIEDINSLRDKPRREGTWRVLSHQEAAEVRRRQEEITTNLTPELAMEIVMEVVDVPQRKREELLQALVRFAGIEYPEGPPTADVRKQRG